MTLKELYPLSNTEKQIISWLKTEEEQVRAILNRRAYLHENSEYTSSLCKEIARARFACHNEKETATMPILTQEDY